MVVLVGSTNPYIELRSPPPTYLSVAATHPDFRLMRDSLPGWKGILEFKLPIADTDGDGRLAWRCIKSKHAGIRQAGAFSLWSVF